MGSVGVVMSLRRVGVGVGVWEWLRWEWNVDGNGWDGNVRWSGCEGECVGRVGGGLW